MSIYLRTFGKYLSEEEKKFSEADLYLMEAYRLEPNNEATPHIIGKRFFDELRELLRGNPPKNRLESVDKAVGVLAAQAHEWFGKVRERNLSSEFGYTTAIQLNIELIRDHFRRLGIRSAVDNSAVLNSDEVTTLLSEAYSLVADGQRYIEPREESRRVFNRARDTLHELRGDLNTAIRCFQAHVRSQRGVSQATAKTQLARLLHERGEINLLRGERGKANKDFIEGERQLFDVLQDPAMKFRNIRLWFDCARHVSHWRRADFLERLHQLHDYDPNSLDAVFLLMCLYFCEALETMSQESWRRYEEFQRKSSTRSANLAIRRYVREWLVSLGTDYPGSAKVEELRVFPQHYFEPNYIGGQGRSKPVEDSRVHVSGFVARVESSTEGYVEIPPMGFRVYFRPRAGESLYYRSDAEKRTPVAFLVGFNYEKAEAYNVNRSSGITS